MHAGHNNPQGSLHLSITIVSEAFDEVNALNRHRQVHQIIKAEMAEQIHALELQLYTPQEWQATTSV